MFDKYGTKEKFISTLTSKTEKINVRNLFNAIEKKEEEYREDIAKLDYLDAREVIKTVIAKKDSHKESYASYFKKYFRYCESTLVEKFDTWDYINLIGDDFRFISYADMKKAEQVINAKIGDNSWMYNALIYCIYYGFIDTWDFIELRKKNVDFERGIIRFDSGKLIDMSDKPELQYYLKQVIDNNCEYTKSRSNIEYLCLYPDSVFKAGVKKESDKEKICQLFYQTYFTGLLKRKIDENIFGKKKIFTKKILSDSGFINHVVKDIPEEKILFDYFNSAEGSYEERFLVNHARTFGIKSSTTQIKRLFYSYDKYLKMGK